MPENLQQTVLGRYQQLIDMQRELASILNVDQLLERIVKSAVTLCTAEHALVLMPDQAKERLQIRATTLPNQSKYRQLSIWIENHLEGWVLNNQQPVMINDLHTYDQQYGKVATPNHFEENSIISVPMIVKGASIGVLDVINKTEGTFTTFDIDLLSSFANQVAIYIVNTQLFVQSDLVSELVHEIRTPLVSLNMAIHLLQRQDLPDEKRQRIFDLINMEFNRLSDMTTSLLEYARLESGRMKFTPSQFDLRDVMKEGVDVMQFQADARGVAISLQASDEPLIITGDRDKLKQVILNLLNNAIKYNHPGGIVSITAQHTPTDLTINVRDDGQGIPEEYMSRLFTRFFRAPNKENQAMGTGLGLSICKQIVEAHHGRLEVISEVDRGSTFTVRLPVTQEEAFIPID
jgi:signal transduction histidine kinase